MPSNPAKLFLVSRDDAPQLQLLNEKISRLTAFKPAVGCSTPLRSPLT